MAMDQNREVSRYRHDIRQGKRECRQARRECDGGDVRREARDVRQSRREYREDWRDYRKQNRKLYTRGNWRSPYRYHAFGAGARIQPGYYAQCYVIAEPRRYRLHVARGSTRCVRTYDDVLLVHTRTGSGGEVRHRIWKNVGGGKRVDVTLK